MRRCLVSLAAALAVLLVGCTGQTVRPAPVQGEAASCAESSPPICDASKLPGPDRAMDQWTLADFPGCLSRSFPTQRTEYQLLPGSELERTVRVLKGEGDGPAVYLIAGVHGDEQAGWRAGTLLSAACLRAGTLYILSPANVYGAQHDQRTTQDGWDLNRSFPGNPAGTDAQRIAAALYGDIREKAPAIVLDLHEARPPEGERDALGNSVIFQSLDEVGELVLDLLSESEAGRLCSAPLTLYGSPPVGSVNRTVTLELAIPVMTVETARSEGLSQRVRNHLEVVKFILERYGLVPPQESR